ncbi:uncharacterized protein LOC6047543 [Culex quinquefasciatus]|uniref:uncharacterized protein LOC6047543 n=1 Tax=Culex quinquefasciatus TaxID=7176 RepID=UPI0018E2D924|nr:uncharacterized protein LOC6047543 [Culex quinquefasciatus]
MTRRSHQNTPSSSINIRLIPFQLAGLCPFSPTSPALTIALLVWTFANLTLVVILLVKVTGSASLLFMDPDGGKGHQLNPILLIKSSFTIAAHVLVLVETLIQHVTFRRVEERLESTDKSLSMVGSKSGPSQRKLLFYLVICATSEVGNFWLAQPLYRTAWYTTVASQAVIRLKHLQHMQYVEGLSIRFRVLKKQLQQFVTTTNAAKDEEKARYSGGKFASHAKQQHSIDGNLPDCLRKVFIIKSTYLALWDAGQLLAGAFTLAQLANLLQNFVQCTCDLYTIYSHLYRNDHHFGDIFDTVLGLIPTLVALLLVLGSCEACRTQNLK